MCAPDLKAGRTHGVRSGSPGLDVFIFYIYIARNLQGFNDRVSAGLLSDARRRFEEIILHLCRRASCTACTSTSTSCTRQSCPGYIFIRAYCILVFCWR